MTAAPRRGTGGGVASGRIYPTLIAVGRRWYPPGMDELPEVLTVQEAAGLLRISVSTAKRLAAAGQLPGAAKFGNQWRVSKAALLEHLESSAT